MLIGKATDKGLMPPAGRDCAPSPLCWEVGKIFRGHCADRRSDLHARWIEIRIKVLDDGFSFLVEGDGELFFT